ncbi:molybdopterin-dependent oxidoreductase [Halomonas sp. YLGW01]|uniref:molybdopterin-dependent oxidoreductase n=1 Tax=Halomonas sp. YLGW01 TaxID=2773308 RepID=UPI00177BA848|nr:molybdopterin-dependent oxidoreductase [Halomonas sp. YLGW01]
MVTSSLLLAADALPQPAGRVVLTVTGNIDVANAGEGERAEFDLEMLSGLPQQAFDTETPWTEGPHRYQGVLLRDLLERVGADGERVRASAMNDYHHDIGMQTVVQEPLLLATHRDGEPMRIRDKGPVRIMLPVSDSPQYSKKRYLDMMVWQLKTLTVR